MNVKQRLQSLKYVDAKIKSKHQELISLKSSILRSQQYTDEPKGTTKKNQSEELNVLIIDKSDELYKEIQELYTERDDLIKAIEGLDDPLENIVMRLFFINGCTWDEVEKKLKASRGTIHQARKSAFEKLSKMI